MDFRVVGLRNLRALKSCDSCFQLGQPPPHLICLILVQKAPRCRGDAWRARIDELRLQFPGRRNEIRIARRVRELEDRISAIVVSL